MPDFSIASVKALSDAKMEISKDRLTILHELILRWQRFFYLQSRGPLLDLEPAARRIEELASKYNLAVDPYAPVWQLSVGEQQRVEIIKALYRGAELLIMDEPTAVLTPQEADELIRVMRGMAESGRAIITYNP